MGAVASGGVRVLNQDVTRQLGITEVEIARVAAAEQKEIQRRERAYRRERPEPAVENRTVILVDDGLATGATMRAAAVALRAQHPERIVVAVPVAAPDICEALRDEVDEVVCALTPEPFRAISLWYRDFEQTTDEEVRQLLGQGGSG